MVSATRHFLLLIAVAFHCVLLSSFEGLQAQDRTLATAAYDARRLKSVLLMEQIDQLAEPTRLPKRWPVCDACGYSQGRLIEEGKPVQASTLIVQSHVPITRWAHRAFVQLVAKRWPRRGPRVGERR